MSDTNAEAAYLDALKKSKTSLFWIGVAMTIIGIIALVFPVVSTVAANFMIGWLFVFFGIISIFGSFTISGTGPFFGALLLGLLILGAGIYLLRNPATGLLVLTIVVAVTFIVEGAYQCAAAFSLRPEKGWGWMLASGIVAIIVSLMILARLPGASLVVLGILVGVNFLSSGIASIMLSRSIEDA